MLYDCKFSEISATLNHKVDELLVGIVSQIRLNKKRHKGRKKDKANHQKPDEGNSCVHVTARDIFNKLFKRNSLQSRSCDNLLVL